MKQKNKGSSFDSWLHEEGIHQEVTSTAIRRVLARQLGATRTERHVSRNRMGPQRHRSRTVVKHLLDPENDA